jgi:hypothetical protein
MIDQLGANRAPQLLLRGLWFAIVDEADSVLIDEARTPLIISGAENDQNEVSMYLSALDFARQFQPKADFTISSGERNVQMTPAGSAKLRRLTQGLGGIWEARKAREEVVSHALSALHLYRIDQHYVVTEGKVQIIDEFTGRIAEGRSWQHGLHQLIETKENCEITQRQRTMASAPQPLRRPGRRPNGSLDCVQVGNSRFGRNKKNVECIRHTVALPFKAPTRSRSPQRMRCRFRDIEETRLERLEQAPGDGPHVMVRLLARVIGVGIETADMLVQEVLSRNLRDRRAVARYGGLTGSPDESGKKRREKGLARSGNARVRRGMIQLAWRFLMFQKDSALARWFYARTKNAPQTRKTMIVALARKLLIALWRLVREGAIPEGLILRPAL